MKPKPSPRKARKNWKKEAETWFKAFRDKCIEHAARTCCQEATNDLARQSAMLDALSHALEIANQRYDGLRTVATMNIAEYTDFKTDLMLLMASQWDVQCGSKLINVKAIQLLLEKYQ